MYINPSQMNRPFGNRRVPHPESEKNSAHRKCTYAHHKCTSTHHKCASGHHKFFALFGNPQVRIRKVKKNSAHHKCAWTHRKLSILSETGKNPHPESEGVKDIVYNHGFSWSVNRNPGKATETPGKENTRRFQPGNVYIYRTDHSGNKPYRKNNGQQLPRSSTDRIQHSMRPHPIRVWTHLYPVLCRLHTPTAVGLFSRADDRVFLQQHWVSLMVMKQQVRRKM